MPRHITTEITLYVPNKRACNIISTFGGSALNLEGAVRVRPTKTSSPPGEGPGDYCVSELVLKVKPIPPELMSDARSAPLLPPFRNHRLPYSPADLRARFYLAKPLSAEHDTFAIDMYHISASSSRYRSLEDVYRHWSTAYRTEWLETGINFIKNAIVDIQDRHEKHGYLFAWDFLMESPERFNQRLQFHRRTLALRSAAAHAKDNSLADGKDRRAASKHRPGDGVSDNDADISAEEEEDEDSPEDRDWGVTPRGGSSSSSVTVTSSTPRSDALCTLPEEGRVLSSDDEGAEHDDDSTLYSLYCNSPAFVSVYPLPKNSDSDSDFHVVSLPASTRNDYVVVSPPPSTPQISARTPANVAAVAPSVQTQDSEAEYRLLFGDDDDFGFIGVSLPRAAKPQPVDVLSIEEGWVEVE